MFLSGILLEDTTQTVHEYNAQSAFQQKRTVCYIRANMVFIYSIWYNHAYVSQVLGNTRIWTGKEETMAIEFIWWKSWKY